MRLLWPTLLCGFAVCTTLSCGGGETKAPEPACTPGRFVMAGFRVVWTTNPDGSWSTIPDDLQASYYDGLAYGKGRLVALGDDGRVVISDDRGATFYRANGSSGVEAYELHFRRDRFIAVGRDLASTQDAPRGLVVASEDGLSWAPITPPLDGGFIEAFDASDGALVVVGGGALAGSLHRYTEAAGWQVVSATGGPAYRGVFHDGQAFLAIASDDPETGRGALARSTDDGVTFEVRDLEPGFVSLSASGGHYFATGFKKVAISEDAASFRTFEFEAPSNRPEDADAWYFYKMAHDGCGFLAVGGLHGWNAKSADGKAWADQLGPTHGNLLEVIHVPEP